MTFGWHPLRVPPIFMGIAVPAEAWIALALGVLGITGTIITAAWYLSSKLSKQDVNMVNMQVSIDKIEIVIEALAVDRDRASALDRRVAKLEGWYDELRRGIGRIE